MKELKQILTERRSVRRYERRPIEQEKLEFIYEAIRNTPTSFNGQQFSVIALTDQDTKVRLSELIGQKQIKTCALFLVFCLDFRKLEVAGRAKGLEIPPFAKTLDGYTVGVIDASLAMMNASVAAEGLGLGSCCIGFTRTAAPAETSEILGLPKGVAIVCGLAVGYPAEAPDIKPKLPVELVIHKEKYAGDGDMEEGLRAFDMEVSAFNRSRAGLQTENDWAGHILDYHREAILHDIADYIERQTGLDSGKL